MDRDGRERASWAEWEKGGKTGGARAEDGAGGGAGRILEVCAGKGAQSPVGRPGGVEWTWNPESSGNAEGGSNGGLDGADRNVRLVPGDIYFKSWWGGELLGDNIWRVVAK